MRLSTLWRIMEIEEGVIRWGRRPKRITPSEISIILRMLRKSNSIIVSLFIRNNSLFKNWLKHAYLHRSIDVKFIWSANILQIADVALRVVFFLFLPCFYLVLTLETSETSAIFVFTTKTTQPRPQIVSVNGALTCKKAALLTSSVHYTKNSSKFGHQ